jgi:CDP-paratose 2-epimerase
MDTALLTGSTGLIGSEAVRFFGRKGFKAVGIDNNMREWFFGSEASTAWNRRKLEAEVPGYMHYDVDIRNRPALERIFLKYGTDVKLIVHAAAQPSHDWAATDPETDFTVNANGTLNLLWPTVVPITE